jgi:hypothetical protein
MQKNTSLLLEILQLRGCKREVRGANRRKHEIAFQKNKIIRLVIKNTYIQEKMSY